VPFPSLDPTHRVFLNTLQRSAAQEGNELEYKCFTTPQVADLNGAKELMGREYDANYAFLFYLDVDQIGPELAYLIHDRREMYRHVFVVTHLQSRVMAAERFIGLTAVTRSVARMRNGLLRPLGEANAEEDGILSFWNVHAMQTSDRTRLLSVLSIT